MKYLASLRSGPASLQQASTNRKLSPQTSEAYHRNGRTWRRPTPYGPRCSSTFVSIEATCPETCELRDGACYVQEGITGARARKLDAAAEGMSGDDVMVAEAALINRAFALLGRVPQDGARGGRDLRLHVGGDVSSTRGARILAAAAALWRLRGGGAVWTYTKRWRRIPRSAFGSISALASVLSYEDAISARARGYVPAIVVPHFPSRRAFSLSHSGLSPMKAIPCPAETSGTTCVQCRLCLDDGRLRKLGVAIAFELHGRGAGKARRRLPVLQRQARAVGGGE